ncbi:Voltage-gated hydrogen channel 1 [Plasmodiophora brassicae]|uniref:Voltage-gated hydrogen channel 1 n=1 Tax=Plasmodiophora brassicae TaxID=37360 RepID=A0A0G4IYY7_PLABS|nr:hypothetical protein PBRA_001595 [Plasmodiophora brassicae]SPQ93964.1 unnamed protein product [Plasmodiophora brassicae]
MLVEVTQPGEKASGAKRFGIGWVRSLLRENLDSERVQTVVASLILVDLLILLVEHGLMIWAIDSEIDDILQIMEPILAVAATVIVWVLFFEILLKLFAFGPVYFFRFLPALDLVVVTAAFTIEVVLHHTYKKIGRLLRLFRLAHAVLDVTNKRMKVKVDKLKTRLHNLEHELADLRITTHHMPSS